MQCHMLRLTLSNGMGLIEQFNDIACSYIWIQLTKNNKFVSVNEFYIRVSGTFASISHNCWYCLVFRVYFVI